MSRFSPYPWKNRSEAETTPLGRVHLNAAELALYQQVFNTENTVANAKLFGAKGDGTTNDTEALHAAVASLPVEGGVVFLPAGTYLCSETLTQKSGVTFAGAGVGASVLKLANEANTTLLESFEYATKKGGSKETTKASQESPYELGLLDLTLDGNKANNTSGNGALWYVGNPLIRRVVVRNFKNVGVKTEWSGAAGPLKGTDSMEGLIDLLKVHDNGEYGLIHAGPHDSVVSNTFAWNNNKAGVWVPEQNSSTVYWRNCHSYSDPASNESISQEYAWRLEHGCILEGCTAEGATKAQVLLAESTRWVGGRAFSTSGGKGPCFQFGLSKAENEALKGTTTAQNAFNCEILDVDVIVPSGAEAAFKFQAAEAGSSHSRIRARVTQKESAVITGTPNGNVDWKDCYYTESSEGAKVRVYYGTGAPGVTTKPQGSNPNTGDQFIRSDGAKATTIYLCTAGGATPTWEAIA